MPGPLEVSAVLTFLLATKAVLPFQKKIVQAGTCDAFSVRYQFSLFKGRLGYESDVEWQRSESQQSKQTALTIQHD